MQRIELHLIDFEKESSRIFTLLEKGEFEEAVNKLAAMTAERLATGDLTIKTEEAATGVYSSVATAVKHLREFIGKIEATSKLVRRAPHDVASGNSNLSERTRAHASNLEEIASSMEQMTAV